jgi:CBS domain containing-hemolysin-like protein
MFEDLAFAIVALALVLLNGFFVLAEFAIVKVRATRLEELAEKGNVRAREAREVLARLDSYLSATQLGITLASLALGWLGEPAFSGLYERFFGLTGWGASAAAHATSVALAFVTIAFVHILVGELAPKLIAIQNAEAAALFAVRPLRAFHALLRVPLLVLQGGARFVVRRLGFPAVSAAEMTYSEEELRSILGASQERGGFSFHHLLLLENAFDFGDLRVRDVAVPLDRVAFLDATRPWPDNAAVVLERRLSRYPLRDGPSGPFIGVVHVKQIALELLAGRTPDLRRLRRDLSTFPEDLLLEVVLRKLQRSGEHMGIAVATSGQVRGIFTLEDIVEELIGDIRDEFESARAVALADILRADAIVLDPEVEDRRRLVDLLVRRALDGVASVSPDLAVEAVEKREKAVPASVSGSVAVPHARVPGLPAPRAAFARIRDGIAYDAPDGRPVRLVVLFLTPAEAAPGVQARLMTRIAGLLQSDYIRDRLLAAQSPEEVVEAFRIGETSAHV